MIEAGTVLQNRYQIKTQIGQGGMGAVYVATDERFGSTVAIKETFFTDTNYSKAFEREARLLNNLRHPALPRVSDHFSDNNGQFIVMEYITGEDLSEMMEKKEGAFPLKDVLNWADQLLDALDYLHTQEMPVIHRDIKPQNLKLTPRGQIILLDFGLAKGTPTGSQNQTATKSVFGYSRNYASIEQMQGTGTDPRSDLYSLGATLYHLITGVPPVDALTRAMQVLNGDKDPLPLANTVHNQVPWAVADVLHRAMALNSNHRPTSALAMRTMLSESADSVADNDGSGIYQPFSTGLLTQNTEIFADIPQPRNTQQGSAQTDVLPIENSANFLPQTETPNVNSFEDETSIKTRKEAANHNIQIPVLPKTQTQMQPTAENTHSGGSKRSFALGAALGGVLLAGSALGGLYVIRPEVFGSGSENRNVERQESKNETSAGSDADTANSNVSANSSTDKANVETVTSKKTTDKTTNEASTTKTVNQTKNNEQSADKEVSETKTEAKVLMIDKEGNKILEDGTIKSNDGVIIFPDGKVVKDGKVLVNPRTNIQIRTVPPNVKIPPLTREQIEGLSPEQRQKLRQIMENNKKQMEEMRRNSERLRRQTEVRPPETPPSNNQ